MENFEDLGKEEFYMVPEGYHEKLQRDIFAKTVNATKTNVFNLRKYWVAAASIVLLFGIGFSIWNLNYSGKSNIEPVFAQNEKVQLNDQTMAIHQVEIEDLEEYDVLTDQELNEISKKYNNETSN